MTITHTPFSLAFELSERQLGATIGYPALVYDASDVQRDLAPRIDTHGTVEDLRDQLAAVQDQIIQRDIWLTDASFVEQDLRLALDEAHQHIGALVAAIDEPDDMGEWIWSEADKATLLSIHLRESHHMELNDRKDAARAWLRRA